MPLLQIAENIWVEERDLRFMGLEMGTRMTVIDLDGKGTLFVHSPNELTHALRAELEKLGKVAHVISPNLLHHLFIADFKTAFPGAKHYCAPGLEKKRADFSFDGIIDSSQNYPWNPTLHHALIEGTPKVNEVVFFHPATRTLVLTDLAMHICESNSFATKLAFRLMGAYGKFGWSKTEKFLFIRDKAKFRRSIEKLLEWDFDRIVLSHGTLVETGGKARLREAFL